MFLFPSLFSFLFLQVVLFPACFGFLSHSRGFPKVPSNPKFFTIFKSEGPEKLIIGGVHVMGTTILRFTVRLFDWAICWGSLNVCLLRPLLFSPVIRFATDKLSKTCPEVKSHRQRPGTKPSGTEGAVSPCTVQMFYGPPGVFIVVVVIAHLPSHFPCVPQARNPLSLVSRRMREGQDSGQSPREWERRSGQTTLSQLALLQLSFSQPPPRL